MEYAPQKSSLVSNFSISIWEGGDLVAERIAGGVWPTNEFMRRLAQVTPNLGIALKRMEFVVQRATQKPKILEEKK